MEEKAYCPVCKKYVSFKSERKKATTELDGKRYSYWVTQATCDDCGAEATYSPYQEAAGIAFNDAVREEQGVVSLQVVRDIPKMYAIGKRPLSRLLKWGEHTYSQLMEGQTPNKEHSETLKRLYEDPTYYYAVLKMNKDSISEQSFKRSERAAEAIIENDYPDAHRIYELGYYFIELAKGDITNLAIQKLVYYAQGFSRPLLKGFLFNQMPKAWARGPVYGQLWREMKLECDGSFALDEKEPYSSPFTAKEDLLIQAVHKHFGCYSGDTLAKMTHSETPWINARKRAGAADGERCDEPISVEDMERYFEGVVEEYGISDFDEIGKYARAIVGCS